MTALSGHGLPVTGAEGGYRARVLPSPLASSLALSGLNAAALPDQPVIPIRAGAQNNQICEPRVTVTASLTSTQAGTHALSHVGSHAT